MFSRLWSFEPTFSTKNRNYNLIYFFNIFVIFLRLLEIQNLWSFDPRFFFPKNWSFEAGCLHNSSSRQDLEKKILIHRIKYLYDLKASKKLKV